MKKTGLTLLYTSLCLLSFGCLVNSHEKTINLPEGGKAFSVKSFHAINATGVFNLFLLQGNKESVLVKGKLPKGLSITVQNGTLMIQDTLNANNSTHGEVKTDIYVTLKNVDNINVQSVGTTACKDTLRLRSLTFHTEGVGATTLWVDADTVNDIEESVGALTIAGGALFAKINSSGVGVLNASSFKVGILHVNVSGVGAASVYATKEIYLTSSGIGGVQYGGPAKVMQNNSSGAGVVSHVK